MGPEHWAELPVVLDRAKTGPPQCPVCHTEDRAASSAVLSVSNNSRNQELLKYLFKRKFSFEYFIMYLLISFYACVYTYVYTGLMVNIQRSEYNLKGWFFLATK